MIFFILRYCQLKEEKQEEEISERKCIAGKVLIKKLSHFLLLVEVFFNHSKTY